MLHINGYQIIEQIAANANAVVYRAYSERDNQPVILKLPAEAAPIPERIARFQHEYTLLKELNAPNIIHCYRLEQVGQRPMLIMEDFGGVALNQTGLAGKMELDAFLRVAIASAACLDQVHRAQLIHKDITPGNLVYNVATDQLKLIDFSLATRLRRAEVTFQSPTILEGTLAYISPEQTGRMNRSVDYRSDFYSLGITLYELLTGQRPFMSEDPLELVHTHLARQPQPPHQINQQIPLALSAIILKLIAKNADDRYQSAYGLAADLSFCLEHLASPEQLATLVPGQHDRLERFQIPQKLYGRSTDITELLAAFERVAAGGRELLLVTGASGVGKTMLVNEIHQPVTAQRGYFIAGKFDQYQRTTPYLGWVQVFTDLIQQLLTESESQLTGWRIAIQAAVGENGRLMTDVIPKLELIIGSQPAVTLLEGREAQQRFELVFRSFIKALAQPKHPLVIFLDDLQWADAASLHLMHLLLDEASSAALLVIGAYRDNEVTAAHPLMAMIADLNQAAVTVTTRTLAPLSLVDMNQLIADALSCPIAAARTFTELVYQKTHGSPFFTTQLLHALHDERLLTFNATIGQWQCDLAQVRTFALTDDAATFMAQQVQKLPHETQALLMLAACIGTQFDLATLALAAEQSLAATAANLWPAIQVGLVMSNSEVYQFVHVAEQSEANTPDTDRRLPIYRFLHDQVRQAAYLLIPNQQQPAMHLNIGRQLLQHTPESAQNELLFATVLQFNHGITLLTEPAERLALVQLNMQAGRKAQSATANRAAWDYYTVARELLPADTWQQHYELTLQVYDASTEAAYLSGEFEQMDKLISVILQQAHSIFDQLKAYEVKNQSLVAQNRLLEAVSSGIDVLEMLGVTIPREPGQNDIFAAFQATQAACQAHGIAALIDLPMMTDPIQLAAMRILSSVAAAAFISAPALYGLLTCKEIDLSLKYGNTPISTHSYACYGLILCGVIGDIQTGYQFGQLAIELLHKLNAKEFECKVQSIVHAFIAHWQEPVRDMLLPLRAAYYSGLETGDLQFAGYSAVLYSAFTYFAGIDKGLIELQRESLSLSTSIHQLKQITAFQYYQMLHQATHDLIEGRSASQYLQGTYYDEATMLPVHVQANDRNGIFYVYSHKLLLNYLFGDYQQAVIDASQTEQYLDGAAGFPFIPIYYCFDSLARLAAYRTSPHDQQEALAQRIEENQAKIKAWAQFAPMNCQHKWDLIEAERQRVFGNQWAALEAYDRAITGAQQYGYLREEALANELAATFYLEHGKTRIAESYMQAAHTGYTNWGAIAKASQLERNYPQLLEPLLKQPVQQIGFSSPTLTSVTTSTSGIPLDLATVIKASQAIAGEIELPRLLKQLMRIVLENAGAQRGVLILEHAGTWQIEAEGDIDNPEITVLQAREVQSSAAVAVGIVSYVIRTCESVVLNDAVGAGPFTDELYIQQNQTRSVLCTPLLNQGRVSGILYLENNLASGAFIPSRVELLRVLSAQMAMALDNAQIYSNLEAKVVERTRELATAKAAAEQANDLKTKFLANMSHELRTPLNAILNFTRFMSKERYGVLNERQIDLQQRVLANSDHLLGLINDILDLSKIEAGRMELFREPTDLSTILNGVMSTAVGLTKEKGLSLHLEADETLPLVAIDKTRVRQVLLNLLSNAAKFTEHGGITLRATTVDNAIELAVVDTGIGIAPEQHALIFEEFGQINSELAQQQGTGLGLPISKRFVEMHGGHMWFESCPGHGSTFAFTLPLNASAN